MGRLRVSRRSHRRGSYVRNGKRIRATRVRGSTFLIRDRGRKGRGKDILQGRELKRGTLGENFFSKSRVQQESILAGKVRKLGEKKVQGELQFVAVVQKRTNPKIAKRAGDLRSWVAKSYEGKKRI